MFVGVVDLLDAPINRPITKGLSGSAVSLLTSESQVFAMSADFPDPGSPTSMTKPELVSLFSVNASRIFS